MSVGHVNPNLTKILRVTNSFNPFIHSINIYRLSLDYLLLLYLFLNLQRRRQPPPPPLIHPPRTAGYDWGRGYRRTWERGRGQRYQRSITALFTECSSRGAGSASWEFSRWNEQLSKAGREGVPSGQDVGTFIPTNTRKAHPRKESNVYKILVSRGNRACTPST